MNISENKRVVALSALFALAFAGVMYVGYGKSQEYAESQRKLDEINNRFLDYESGEGLAPTRKNRDALKAAFAQVSDVNKDLQQELNQYAAFCFGDGKKISAQDFQNELRDAIGKTRRIANECGAKVSSPAADLGLASFKNAAPVADDAPFRSFQLKAVARVAETILKSGAPVLDKIYCAPLPAAAAESVKPNSRKAAPYFPLRFEVAFEARRGVLPKVINSIMKDKDFFLTITGIAVKGKDTLPMIDAYSAPGAAPQAGDDLGASSAEGTAAPIARSVAVRKTGDPDETVRVHMNMQVLYFNPAKTK